MGNKRILAFAREAGGAAAIAPVIALLKSAGADVAVCSKDAGVQVFERWGQRPIPLAEGSGGAVTQIFAKAWGGALPDCVFTSATSLPQLDMTEKHLWQWAGENDVPSVAVLDQWQNYGLRFSGTEKKDYLKYLPDVCCVMDEIAKTGMERDGFPAERIAITGQPAFDAIAAEAKPLPPGEKAALLAQLGFQSDRPLVMFVGEPIRLDFNTTYGYDECSTLRALLEILGERPVRPNLLVKKHPANTDDDYVGCGTEEYHDRMNIRIVGTEFPPRPLARAADVVVGMASILLTESILLERPTMSFQPDAQVLDKCFPATVGALPLITARKDARTALYGLLDDPAYRADWMARQGTIRHLHGAAHRVVDIINSRCAIN